MWLAYVMDTTAETGPVARPLIFTTATDCSQVILAHRRGAHLNFNISGLEVQSSWRHKEANLVCISMRSSSIPDFAKHASVNLATLDTQQLSQVKKQLEEELEHLTSSFAQLHAVQGKFRECLRIVKTRPGSSEGIAAPRTQV